MICTDANFRYSSTKGLLQGLMLVSDSSINSLCCSWGYINTNCLYSSSFITISYLTFFFSLFSTNNFNQNGIQFHGTRSTKNVCGESEWLGYAFITCIEEDYNNRDGDSYIEGDDNDNDGYKPITMLMLLKL